MLNLILDLLICVSPKFEWKLLKYYFSYTVLEKLYKNINNILTLLPHVLTDENDNIEIDTNEEIPEGFVVGGGDELTNLEYDLDTSGNFKL